jgi:uncharacterized membrane protein YphA (DoxX/SURF4 family)
MGCYHPVLEYGGTSRPAAIMIGRILIGGIFAQSGYEKLMDISAFVGSLANSGMPVASILVLPAALIEFGAA